MKELLRILHLEDDPVDAELVQATLKGEGLDAEIRVVDGREDFVAALKTGRYSLILADYALPGFDGMSALKICRRRNPEIPFIFVSGRLGEEAAIESLKNGATDYVLKNRLSRLAPAVRRALEEAREHAELRGAEREIEKARAEIRERAESYHNLFNSIRDLILVTDDERRVLQANRPALRELFGYELEELAGKGSRMLYADGEGYRSAGEAVFDRGQPLKGALMELSFRRKNGETFIGEMYALKRLDPDGTPTGNIGMIRDVSKRKMAEEALRQSELQRLRLQVQLACAAEVQANLLPHVYPHLAGFEIAARCLPAYQVGGDFYDWQQVGPSTLNLTLGDIMGKGMGAAMLMATVRSALRAVSKKQGPAEAMRLAEKALWPDLEGSESFVTLFHAQLNAKARSLAFVDCGHGYAFLRRSSGTVESLNPRVLPMGILGQKSYREGHAVLEKGDTLVLYSDGLPDARPELLLDNPTLAGRLGGVESAGEMVNRLMEIVEPSGALPDDVTVLVVRCSG